MNSKALQRLWLKAVMFSLFGYAMMGKGFAYFFFGEMILIVGLLIFCSTGRFMLIFSDSVLMLWGAFAFWGFCRTVPYIGKYHFDALRDAVLWGYGFFTLLIVAFVTNSDQISRALNAYRKFLFWYLPLVPFLLLASTALRDRIALPELPWGQDVTIIMIRAGETSVHLAGAALLLLIFSERRPNRRGSGISIFRSIGILGFLLTTCIVAATSRGGFLALAAAITLASALRLRTVGWKVAGFSIASLVFALMVLSSGLFTFQVHGRAFTLDQISTNVASIFGGGGSEGGDTQDTKSFRLLWWAKIVRYTFLGPYRWTGKGFGVNLALEDGAVGASSKDSSLRSPHNGNMTVLARMGVPGLFLWVALNGVFAFRLARAYSSSKKSGSAFWSGVNLWILCYWVAAFVNMSFDVYLEGPEGGIWFWSIIGFGVAVTRIQAFEARQRKLALQLQMAAMNEERTSAIAI